MKKILSAASVLCLGLGLAGGAEASTVKIAFTIHSSASRDSRS